MNDGEGLHGGSQSLGRARLLNDIGGLQIRLLAGGLPEETVALLDYDLTLQQLRAFAVVFARGQAPVNQVAEALGVKANVATGIIQRLVDRGLIERREDPADRRVRQLTMTAKGAALIDNVGATVLSKGRRLLERLTDSQLEQLRDLLSAMETPPDV
jgi:DNA-binding MarR family transcriptional regulator